MKSPATMTPVEIDTILSDNYRQSNETGSKLDREKAYMELASIRFGRATPNAEKWSGYQQAKRSIEAHEVKIEAYRAELKALADAALPYQNEYRQRPWLRYFLVILSSNGHVHREMHCSSCYPTTQYSWLVSLADCDEKRMVGEYGEKACTVCFPDAPTMPEYAASQARAKIEADKICPGSGKFVRRGEDRYYRCPDCDIIIRPTQNQNVRKHNKPEVN